MDEEERRRKIEVGRAKLAQYRRRKERREKQEKEKQRKEQDKKDEFANEIQKNQANTEATSQRVINDGNITPPMSNTTAVETSVENPIEQLQEKNQEICSLHLELASSKEKEKQYSLIKQLTELVQDLQKKNYKDNLEAALMQRKDEEMQQKLGNLQRELDERYENQIVQMKGELLEQHMSQMEELKCQHKREMETTLKLYGDAAANGEGRKLMKAEMEELNMQVRDIFSEVKGLKEELCIVKGEKHSLQSQISDLLEEVKFLRQQTQKTRETTIEQESAAEKDAPLLKLEHVKVTQSQFTHEACRQNQEAKELPGCLEELPEVLDVESSSGQQLNVELRTVEYGKNTFEREIQKKIYMTEGQERQLLYMSPGLQDLEAEPQQVQEEPALVSGQKAATRVLAGPVENRPTDAAMDAAPGAECLQRTENQRKGKLEEQCQAKEAKNALCKQLKMLEICVEEKISPLIEMEQDKNVEITSLRQQNQALERQLKKMRRLIAVKELTNCPDEKSDKHCELLPCKEQLQRDDVPGWDEEVGKPESPVRKLEQALLVNADSFPKAASTAGLAYSNIHQTNEIYASDSESDLDQEFGMASEGGEENESGPVSKDIECQTSVKFLQKAERKSLLAENTALHDQINGKKMTQNKEQRTVTSSQEFLDCSMQKSSVWGIQHQPHGMKDRVAELKDQLILETANVLELKIELSQIKPELDTVCNQLKELEVQRREVKDKTEEEHLLTDTLAIEQKRSQDLQCASETEEAKSGHQKERDKELKELSSWISEILTDNSFSMRLSAVPSLRAAPGISVDGGPDTEDVIAPVKVWSKEKLTLQETLKRGEEKRIYDKNLRAESFRKALKVRKKYLSLSLGQFQDFENATLELLCLMEGNPGFRNPDTVTRIPKEFTRFHRALRASIDYTRMKLLVEHPVSCFGVININREVFELIPDFAKTDPLDHSTSILELYGESQQRTYHSRYPGTPKTLTYALLQRYNPGRTLTDCVIQMKALKRLGDTLQTGSTPSQFHCSMRT